MICKPGLSYRLTSQGARRVRYTGSQHHWFLCVYSAGATGFIIDGALTIDGGGRCSMPFFARFEGVSGKARRAFHVSGLTACNARMRDASSAYDGSRTSGYGAAAMCFLGGFDDLTLRNVRAVNVGRDAGVGRLGTQGCAGIAVLDVPGGFSARRILIEDFEVSGVDSDDLPGSPARADMDGLIVFQLAEPGGEPPVIQRGVIREAAGRAVKVFAEGGGGVTRNLDIFRSVPGSSQGSNDLAHQHGDGVIEDIRFHYSGDAHMSPTTPIGMSAGHLREEAYPFGPGVIRNISIEDTTGRPKFAVVTLFSSLQSPTRRSYTIQDLIDDGTAERLFTPGNLGTFANALVEVDRVKVNLTTSLMATEDLCPLLRVVVRRLTNQGPRTVPFNAYYDGRPAPRLGGSKELAPNIEGISP